MPKSRVRKKVVYTPPSDVLPSSSTQAKRKGPSPTWYPVVMCVLIVLGLVYIVVNYVAGTELPVMEDLGAWNFGVGFGLMVAGLGLAVRWR